MENRKLSIINLNKEVVEKEFKVVEEYGVMVLTMLSVDNDYLISWCNEDDNSDHWFIITNKEYIDLYLEDKKSLRDLIKHPSTLYAHNNFSDNYTVINYAKNMSNIEDSIADPDSFFEGGI